MSCKDCLHYEICEALYEMNGISKIFPSQCSFYKNNKMNNWISVKEDKKPRHLQDCLIAYVYGDDDSDRHFYGVERYYAFGGNGLVDRPHFGNEGVEGMRVTHWIPIPKLPKGE